MRAIAAVAVLSGCSFAFVSGPPANHQQLPYFECSSGRTAPVLDTLFAALQVLNFATLAGKSDAEFNHDFEQHTGQNDRPFKRQTGMGINVAFGLLGAAGAYYGFTKTAQCRAAKQELMIRMTSGQQPQQPGIGTWPPPQPMPAPAPPPAPAPAPVPEPAPAPDPYAPPT